LRVVKNRDATCPVCGQSFIMQSNRKFCGGICREKAWLETPKGIERATNRNSLAREKNRLKRIVMVEEW
jgi:hypothetical protein